MSATARLLLTSVFGPYARDDEYGSRAINPMELYHNQVTRLQGPFSLRMFHRSWGLMMIQDNLQLPSTLLDFPTLPRFVAELRRHRYDVVGISSIVPNVGKVGKMCELIRQIQPRAAIVVGGHVAALPGLAQRVQADHIVSGDGISWMRRFLGEDVRQPIRHPEIPSAFGARTLGLPLPSGRGHTAAVLIPSVGCPMGCNFCSTSAMFGGKGKFVNFYQTGQELFQVMCRLEARMGVSSFFVMDENFLLYRKRALQLLECMGRAGKSWSLYVFSSAGAIQKYSMEELTGLGVSWVWMGLEGEDSDYAKLQRCDTRRLVGTLQSHGIRVLGSSIIGLEQHTPETMDRIIHHAVSHKTDFHQFMLYTPVPGTPLYTEHARCGTLLADVDEADTHGQYRFNFRHPHISRRQSEEFLLRAFRRDYQINGPSILRIMNTLFEGWKRYRQHGEARVRERFRREGRILRNAVPAALWAMERYFRHRAPDLAASIRALGAAIRREFGLRAWLAGWVFGPVLRLLLRWEEKRLDRGWTREPPGFVERKNWGSADS